MALVYRRRYKAKLPDGTVETRKQNVYTIEYTDAAGKRVRRSGYKDKGATKQLAAKLELAAARGEEGMVNEFRPHRARKTAEHLVEYLADLTAAGLDGMYVYNAGKRIGRLIEACDWTTLGDIDADSFIAWRERFRQPTAKGKKRRKAQLSDAPSATTLNQYLDTARAFLNWCAQMKRLPGVPVGERTVSTVLSGVKKSQGAKVRKRRALTDPEVSKLLAVAGEDRRLVYRVALAVGLRRQELADLKWGDVRLNAIKPYLQLREEATKARRGDPRRRGPADVLPTADGNGHALLAGRHAGQGHRI